MLMTVPALSWANNYLRHLASFLDPYGLGFNVSVFVHRPFKPNLLISQQPCLRTGSNATLPGTFAVGLVVFMRGAAMAITEADWQAEFETWLAPFLTRLRRAEQRRWAPVTCKDCSDRASAKA